MATSGSRVFNPALVQHVEEAAERAGLNPQALTAEHIISLRRSMGFIFSSWANRGFRQWTFNTFTETMTVGLQTFDLPAGALDVQTVFLRRNGIDTEMIPISREDYWLIPDKDMQGRPDRYFVDRRRDDDSATRLLIYIWQAGENTTDQIWVSYYQQIEDPSVAGTAEAQNTLSIPFRFQEAFVSDLAARTAMKFKPERYEQLKVIAEMEAKLAFAEDRDKAPFLLSVAYDRRNRRRS
jgi:hypothetical protein